MKDPSTRIFHDWNTSKVTNMEMMFRPATSFNQDISSWDVSSVVTMKGMFCGARPFKKDISSWDMSNVISWCDVGFDI